MEANELRIGNWLMRESQREGFLVDSNTISRLFHSGTRDELPIPLTEEWLVKFGFEYPKGDDSRDYGYLSGYFIGLNDGVWEIEIGGSSDPGSNDHVKLPYVHTLQNLYFALTGDELTIK